MTLGEVLLLNLLLHFDFTKMIVIIILSFVLLSLAHFVRFCCHVSNELLQY